MALLVGELLATFNADPSKYLAASKKVRADAKSTVDQVSRDKAKIDADTRPFERAADRTIRTAGIMRAKVGNFIGEMRGELLAVGAVAGIIGGFRAVVMAASDLNESANAINTTFGDAAGQVLDFTSTASRSIGQSDTEARQAAATFGVYGKQAGLASEKNAQFSISLAKLASDLASFRNTTTAEAIEALGAALRGESDPIEKYGVLLNESVIAQRALKMGVIDTTSQALSPQQRVLVAYAEIMEQTKDAQGDFGKTSGELANQLRTLRAVVIDKAAALGQDLLPVAKDVVSFFTTSVGPAFDVVGAILKTTLGVVGELADAWSSLPGPVQAALAAVLAWRLVQDRVTDGASSLRDRLVAPWQEMRVQAALGAMEGEKNVGRLSVAMATLEKHSPVIAGMADAYRKYAVEAGGAATQTGALASRAKGAAAAVGSGLKSAVSGLAGVLGGAWGIAITAGTLLLGGWIASSQKAQAEQKELAQAGKEVADAIREQNGVITDGVRAKAAQTAQDSGMLDLAQDLGVALPQVTNAILNQGDAYDTLTGQLEANIAKLKEQRDAVGGDPATAGTATELQAQIDKYESLLGKLRDQVGGYRLNSEQLAAATGLTVEEVEKLAGATGESTEKLTPLAEAMKLFADESATSADKVNALKAALDELNGEEQSVEEATQAINDTLRDLRPAFDEAIAAAEKHNQVLIDSSGAIRTNTEAGSNLQNQVQQLASDYNGLFAATVEAATAQGKSMPEALVAAAQATGPTRQRLIDVAKAAGLNTEQINSMVEHYGMVPGIVATAITQPGMVEGILNAIGLKGKIESIPNGWQTILTSTAPEQIRLMESLGFKVQRLPNGRILVTANTAQAWTEINKITSPKTLIINLQAQGFHGRALASARKQYGLASGAVMEYYANGGIRRMDGSRADIVQPAARTGVLRTIADNPRFNEAFIPLDPTSARSQGILDQVLQEMRPRQAILDDVLRQNRPNLAAVSSAVGMASGGMVGGAAGAGMTGTAGRAGHSFVINGPNPDAVAREVIDRLDAHEWLHGA